MTSVRTRIVFSPLHHGRAIRVEIAEGEAGPVNRGRGALRELDVPPHLLGLARVVRLRRDVEIEEGGVLDGRVDHELVGLGVHVHLGVQVVGLPLRRLHAHFHRLLPRGRAGDDPQEGQLRVCDLDGLVDGKSEPCRARVDARDHDPAEHDAQPDVGEIAARAAELAVPAPCARPPAGSCRPRRAAKNRMSEARGFPRSERRRATPTPAAATISDRRELAARSCQRLSLPGDEGHEPREQGEQDRRPGSSSSCRRRSGPARGCLSGASGEARRCRAGSRRPARRHRDPEDEEDAAGEKRRLLLLRDRDLAPAPGQAGHGEPEEPEQDRHEPGRDPQVDEGVDGEVREDARAGQERAVEDRQVGEAGERSG